MWSTLSETPGANCGQAQFPWIIYKKLTKCAVPVNGNMQLIINMKTIHEIWELQKNNDNNKKYGMANDK